MLDPEALAPAHAAEAPSEDPGRRLDRGVFRLLDALPVIASVIDAAGRLIHRSPRWRTELGTERRRLEEMAARLQRTMAQAQSESDRRRRNRLWTSSGRWALQGTVLDPATTGVPEPLTVVHVEPAANNVLSDLVRQDRLSLREREVAELIAQGLTGQEIARALGLSLHTVRRHTERIMRKLGVQRRVRLAGLLAQPSGTPLPLSGLTDTAGPEPPISDAELDGEPDGGPASAA